LTVEALEDRTVPSFLAPVSFNTGDPYDVAVGDFNRDGVPDVVTATNSGNQSSTVSVLLGNGDGSFQPARNTAGVSGGGQLLVGDLNGDGKADVVLGYSALLGNGDGTFQPAHTFTLPTGQLFSFEAVGDFNNDGKLDLAVSAYTRQDGSGGRSCREWCSGGGGGGHTTIKTYVNVLLGQGDGSFQLKSTTQGAGGGPIALGDFNGDGKLDVLAPGLSLLPGNGDGTLRRPTAVAGAGGAASVPLTVADFNGDGKLDFLSLNYSGTGTNTLSVFLGNGNGAFQAAQTFTAGTGPTSAAVGDFNHDGKRDLVTTDGMSGIVNLLLGNGNGTFQTAQSFAAGSDPYALAAADFNGDGFLDLVVNNYDPLTGIHSFALLLNDAHW
jgi:hypothetical protein